MPPNTNMLILGIDPSIHHTGIAIISIDGGELVGAHAFVAKRFKSMRDGEYLAQLCSQQVPKVFEAFPYPKDADPKYHVAIEGAYLGHFALPLVRLSEVIGVCKAWAWSESVPCHEYGPSEIKKSVTGSGRATKEQVKQAVIEQTAPFLASQNKMTHDESDAVAVALCHWKRLRAAATRNGEHADEH